MTIKMGERLEHPPASLYLLHSHDLAATMRFAQKAQRDLAS